MWFQASWQPPWLVRLRSWPKWDRPCYANAWPPFPRASRGIHACSRYFDGSSENEYCRCAASLVRYSAVPTSAVNIAADIVVVAATAVATVATVAIVAADIVLIEKP